MNSVNEIYVTPFTYDILYGHYAPMPRVHNRKEQNALKNPMVKLERAITPQ